MRDMDNSDKWTGAPGAEKARQGLEDSNRRFADANRGGGKRLLVARGIVAVGYAAALTLVLVQSSSHPVVGAPAPPGPPDLGREILLTSGHLVGFGLLTVLWAWTFRATLSRRRAVVLAVLIALALGVVTESAQSLVIDRSASVIDLLANAVAVVVAAWWVERRCI
jgi:VanZ family protein